ncbi:hypothetical protein [Streptomyces sp. SM12]|uniref:hypothetical protein n=1 Tax=Streptomyces sp. SM12 TaxID=1071602 RepID=UPI000CD54BC4|nr:hypothetical protein [Streptomyces sp. SM12]
MSLNMNREDAEQDYQTQLAQYEALRQHHELVLAQAGYGPEARADFIAGGHSEVRAEKWDNMVIPAAAARGEIPWHGPVAPMTPEDTAAYEAKQWAADEYRAKTGRDVAPFDNDTARDAYVEIRVAELMREAGYGPEVAESATCAELDQTAETAGGAHPGPFS